MWWRLQPYVEETYELRNWRSAACLGKGSAAEQPCAISRMSETHEFAVG